jgi:phytoene synthase
MDSAINSPGLDKGLFTDWGRPLLSLAYEATRLNKLKVYAAVNDKARLIQAYAHGESVATIHSRSFFMASRLLSAQKRQDMRALYAFCRTTDDIVDHPTEWAADVLCDWWGNALQDRPPIDDPVAVAWADTVARYQIPTGYAEQLIQGVARDLHQTRYETFAELAKYCYGVASTVGLMSMHIIAVMRPSGMQSN